MKQKKQLLPFFKKEIYTTLWKSKYTEEYILDFLNSYFHCSGENKIVDIEIINPKQFTNDKNIRKRIHVTFKYLKQRYYYEIKFNAEQQNEHFDDTFLEFVHYLNRGHFTYKGIGQIILEFKIDHVGTPIDHYYIHHEQEKLSEDGIDIHVIYVSTLKKILNQKSVDELNRFERWITLFMTDDFEYGICVADNYEPMLSFLNCWYQASSELIEHNRTDNKASTVECLLAEREKNIRVDIARKLLSRHSSIEFITEVTGVSISTVIGMSCEIGVDSDE